MPRKLASTEGGPDIFAVVFFKSLAPGGKSVLVF